MAIWVVFPQNSEGAVRDGMLLLRNKKLKSSRFSKLNLSICVIEHMKIQTQDPFKPNVYSNKFFWYFWKKHMIRIFSDEICLLFFSKLYYLIHILDTYAAGISTYYIYFIFIKRGLNWKCRIPQIFVNRTKILVTFKTELGIDSVLELRKVWYTSYDIGMIRMFDTFDMSY